MSKNLNMLPVVPIPEDELVPGSPYAQIYPGEEGITVVVSIYCPGENQYVTEGVVPDGEGWALSFTSTDIPASGNWQCFSFAGIGQSQVVWIAVKGPGGTPVRTTSVVYETPLP
ncbi:MAG: hypothetical protein ACFB10_24295 [Salibacteraceae bacterium]